MLRRIGLAAALLSLAPLAPALGCGSRETYNYAMEPDPRRQEFRVDPLDQISVVVWKNRELSVDVTVRPDGIITLPLIGDVKAAGHTPSELQKEISARLATYLKEEERIVSVGVSSVNSYHFTVMGQVEHAGYYTSKNYVTVLEAVAMAGGPNRFAGHNLYIVRGTPARKIPIDLRRAESSEHADENLVVLRGDLLVMQ